ncbi:MAG: DsbA family protein [Salibacteraceae bacterium]
MNKLLFIIALSLMNYNWINAQNPVIIYIGDPMCSWCYGFAPEITKVKQALPNHEFKVVLGGLRPGGTETMVELGDFLEHHWKEVQERSGQPINYGILSDESFVLDTEPSCRAVVVAREMKPSIELDFFKSVQHAFYAENKDMRSVETFVEIAGDYQLDSALYRSKFISEEARYTTRNDFQLAAEMGIKGFPSVVVRHNGQLFLAANGYRTAEDLLKVIEKIQAE